MSPEITAMVSQGRAYWDHVQQHPIEIHFDNPGGRFLLIGGLLALGAGGFGLFKGLSMPVWIALALGILIAAWSILQLVGEQRVGGLSAEITRDYIGFGCFHDRLRIPWDAFNPAPDRIPIDEDFLAIPTDRGRLHSVQYQRQGEAPTPWDGHDYKRHSLKVRFDAKTAELRLSTRPNNLSARLANVVLPMMLYRMQHPEVDEPGAERATTPTVIPASAEQIKRAGRRLQALTRGRQRMAEMLADRAFVGPRLWREMRSAGAIRTGGFANVESVDPNTGGVQEAILLVNDQGRSDFESAFAARTLGIESLAIRRLKNDEIGLYWRVISWDIDEPILIMENEHHCYLVHFYQGSDAIFWIDDIKGQV